MLWTAFETEGFTVVLQNLFNSENAEHDIWARYLTQWHDDKGLRYGI